MLLSSPTQSADLEAEIQALEAQIANAGAHLRIDSAARAQYRKLIKAMADDLRLQASTGRITWAQAASQASEVRNSIMQIIRSRSTPVGRSIAEKAKRVGKTLNELIAQKAIEIYGPNVDFSKLAPTQKNAVYAAIVKSSGTSRPRFTAAMRRLSYAGRGLIVLSLAISVYSIVEAEDKMSIAKREVAVTGAGIGGGIASGALAGLACGPAAPACVTVGAFAGGVLAAFGVALFW